MSEKQTTIYEDGLKIVKEDDSIELIKDNTSVEVSIDGKNVWIKENGETTVYLEWQVLNQYGNGIYCHYVGGTFCLGRHCRFNQRIYTQKG